MYLDREVFPPSIVPSICIPKRRLEICVVPRSVVVHSNGIHNRAFLGLFLSKLAGLQSSARVSNTTLSSPLPTSFLRVFLKLKVSLVCAFFTFYLPPTAITLIRDFFNSIGLAAILLRLLQYPSTNRYWFVSYVHYWRV